MAAPSLSRGGGLSPAPLSDGGSRLSGSSVFSPATSLLTAEGLASLTSSPFPSHGAGAAATTAGGYGALGGAGGGGAAAAASAFSRGLTSTPHTFSDDPFFFGLFEKLPLVFDIGDCIVKAGYGGEPEPACLLRVRRRRRQLCSGAAHSGRSSSRSPGDSPSSSSSTSSSNSTATTSSSSSTSPSSSSSGGCSGNPVEDAWEGRVRSVFEAEAESPYISAAEALVAAESSSSYCREASPSFLLRTTAETSYLITRRRIQRLLHYLIFKGLRVSPRERKVVICEALLHAEKEKHALVDVLFKEFDVSAVSFIPAVVSPLYCCGIDFGLVVDVGLEETRIAATAGSSLLLQSFVCCRIGGAAVDRELRRLLLLHAAQDPAQRNLVEALSPEQLENCKIQCCYVRYSLPQQQQQQEKVQQRHQGETEEQEEEQQQQEKDGKESRKTLFEFYSDKEVFFRAAGDKLLRVKADLRWKPCEVFFCPAEDTASDTPLLLHEAILESLLRCPREVRVLAAQNVVLCGGSVQLRGMTTRLAVELDRLLETEKNGLQPLRPLIKFGVPAYSPLLRAWTGASMHAALDGRSEYTREQFLKKVPLSDWASWVLHEHRGTEEDAAERSSQSSGSNTKKRLLHAAAREAGGAAAGAAAGGGGEGKEGSAPPREEEEEVRSYHVSNYIYECGFD